MGMEWFIILLIWLVAPFAELAAIIVLAVANSRYKRRIWELARRIRECRIKGRRI